MRNRMVLQGLVPAAVILMLPGAAGADTTTGIHPFPAATEVSKTSVDEADSLYALAGQYYAEQRYEDAIPLFVRVVELRPRHGNAYALLGGAYFQLGDYPHAIGAFERALELDEGIKLAYLGLVASNYLIERIEAAQGWIARMVPILTGEEREHYLAMIAAQFPNLDLPGS